MQGEVVEQRAVDSGEVCASCGRTIGQLEQPFIWGDSIVCFGCHRHLANQDAQSSARGEYTFLSDHDVRITSRRLAFGNTSFDLGLVRFARMHTSPPRRWLGLLTACVGIATALCGLNRHLDESDRILLLVGAILLILGAAWALLIRPTFSIILTLADSEHIAFRSRSRRVTARILAAIAQAIIERGQASIACSQK